MNTKDIVRNVVSKQALFIIAIVIVFFIILALMYFQIIILSGALLLVVAIVFIISAVMIIIWWWLSRRKRPLRIGKDLDIEESRGMGQSFFANQGLLLAFPSTHLYYGETRFGSKGATRLHGFAGILFKRVKQIGTGKDAKMQPINPHDLKEIGRGVVIIDATEKSIHSFYGRPYKEQYEDIWKRVPGVSATREPELVVRRRVVTPLGEEREEITAPVGSEEVKHTEEKVV